MTWLISLGILVALTLAAPGMTAALFAWIGGFILGIGSKLLDISLYALVARFDAVVYSSLAPVINQLWTVFRDIANIIIIGMFTFIALSMILGIEKFNARQMVARVLLVAVLINFSLLFTRIIIESSNFVARQFYCSMVVDTGQSSVCTASAASALDTLSAAGASNNGIGLQFMEFLGAKDILQARDTANKIYWANASWSNLSLGGNFFALLYGLTTAALLIAVALVFAYIVFLLVARTILFLFLLVLSAPAFAAYLIPDKGKKYWSMWWDSLLRNAIFAPLLMMMLWATFLISRGLAESVGRGRSFDALFTNQASGAGFLALLVFAIILGMMYASARFASSFAKGIGGFDWASFAPAIGAGLLGRAGGFLGRQTFGRVGALARDDLAQRAKDAKAGSYAQRLYNLGSQQFAGVAKRDFNVMRTQLGKEIAGVARMKDIAGKEIGGFQGAQDTFKKQLAESAKQLAYSDEDKKAKAKKALEEQMKSNPALKTQYEDAQKAHEEAQKTLEEARKNAAIAQSNIESRYQPRIKKLEQDLDLAEAAYASDPSKKGAADAARAGLRKALKEQQNEMKVQNERIKRATNSVKRTVQQFEDISQSIGEAAIAAGKMPSRFVSAGEVAEKTVKNSYSAILRATKPTQAGVDKLAEKIGKEAGKPKEDPHEMIKIVRKIAKEKLEDEQPKKP